MHPPRVIHRETPPESNDKRHAGYATAGPADIGELSGPRLYLERTASRSRRRGSVSKATCSRRFPAPAPFLDGS